MIGSISPSSSYASVGAGRQPAALTDEQLQQLRELQATDRKVKAHEQAHMAAGAGLVLGSSYDYEVGPDKQRYAVAGEVRIDTSPGSTPAETLSKAQQIKAAALAPADPSPQDRQVAAQAMQMEMQARQALAEENRQARESAGGAGPAIAAYQGQAMAALSPLAGISVRA